MYSSPLQCPYSYASLTCTVPVHRSTKDNNSGHSQQYREKSHVMTEAAGQEQGSWRTPDAYVRSAWRANAVLQLVHYVALSRDFQAYENGWGSFRCFLWGTSTPWELRACCQRAGIKWLIKYNESAALGKMNWIWSNPIFVPTIFRYNNANWLQFYKRVSRWLVVINDFYENKQQSLYGQTT